jgi:transposase-like protein
VSNGIAISMMERWSGKGSDRVICAVLFGTDIRSSQYRFFQKALIASHTVTPRVINVDKNTAYPKALKELKAEGIVPERCELRQVKYLNNRIEQDHRFIKRLTNPGIGFLSFATAERTL